MLRSAKGAGARHQAAKELAGSSGGAPHTATVLREFLKSNGKRFCAIGKSRWGYESLLFALIGSIAGVAPLRGDTFWGATADGNARQFEITCDTCPNPVTELSNLSNGGFGSVTAGVEFSQSTQASYSAVAALNGPNALPTLHALASGDVTVVAPSTFFFAATADARGTQLYTYSGTSPSEYTLEYNVDGAISGGLLSEIAGGFTVFGKDFDPGQEIQPVLGFTFDHANGNGTELPVHLTGDVTFIVNPGDQFFVQATLESIVDSRSGQLPAVADASHTLGMQFTEGDTSLLTPAAEAVADAPESLTMSLLGIGLACVGLATRRRRRSGFTSGISAFAPCPTLPNSAGSRSTIHVSKGHLRRSH
jgi:hypothetical protein